LKMSLKFNVSGSVSEIIMHLYNINQQNAPFLNQYFNL
jgi:hypothetical protein